MEIVLNSLMLVGATEMGDKTQLLAFMLASRYKKPWAILAGIFVATILNHLLASWVGQLSSELIPPNLLKWILASLFFGFAVWVLIPDKDGELQKQSKFGPFLTTVIAFFLAEMGDKTQLSTMALAAKYHSIVLVTLGSTMGMMVADGLAVFFGDKMAERIAVKYVRYLASVLFVIFGIGLLVGF